MKSVLITGSSRGIGRVCALEFAKKGFRVFINSRKNIQQLEIIQEEISKEGGLCHLLPGDVSSPKEVDSMFKTIERICKGLDVLVNNAGISQIGLMADLSDAQWQDVIETNLSSVFFCSKRAVPFMIQQQNGKIVNISSIWARYGASCEVAYSASKAGVDGFTKALAKELAPSNIQVNALSLGVIDTIMNQVFTTEELHILKNEIPANRLGTPKEVANLVLDLATGHDYLTGQIIGLDGGF